MQFEWDARKDRANREKHGLSFDEAKRLFTSGLDYLEIYDEAHSGEEDRFIAIGAIRRGTVVVAYVECEGETIRIVSARMATQEESRQFDAFWRGRR